jgi:hypothetical protein
MCKNCYNLAGRVTMKRSWLKRLAISAAVLLAGLRLTNVSAEEASPADAPTPVPAGEEVEIDLNALEEQESPNEKKSIIPDEPTLPVTVTEVELGRRPPLALVAIAVALPVLLMLLPPKRTRKRRHAQADDDPKDEKET